MSQLEELQVFVKERLHAATSEILGAVVKAVTDYEEQAVRLKEENHRNRSLLDVILKAQATLTEAGRAEKRTPVTAAGPDASDSIPARKARETPRCSSDLQRVFNSRTDFLKFAGNGNCPYCLRRNQATEKHLMKKHYLPAVHFTEHGTQKFIVPCLCKYLIKGRSHWHCSYCSSILTRKGNFELHLTKQHACTILLQSQDAEIYQPAVSAIEEEVPLSPEPGYQQEFSSLDRETQQAAPLLQVKEEERETCRRVSHPGWQNSEQLQIEGEQIQKGNSQTSLEADNANIVVMDSYIRDLGEINSVENDKTHPHSNSSNQHLETQLNSGVGGIRHPAGESQHTTPCSSLKALDTKRKAGGKRKKSLPPLKSTQLSISQNPAGPHRCKACGKTFHYMYTLRTHAQTHAMDKLHICGICGNHRCYDYVAIAESCDLLFVMSYDEQSQIMGDCIAMANAPLSQTLEGYDQFLSLKIDPKKLVMGVPWYGYDYQCLNFTQEGVCFLTKVPFRGAPCSDAAGKQKTYKWMMKQINSSMSGRLWDDKQKAPYFNYKDQTGQIHQVWYDDPQSICPKAEAVKSKGLRGIGMWNGNILDYSDEPVAKQQTAMMWNVLLGC